MTTYLKEYQWKTLLSLIVFRFIASCAVIYNDCISLTALILSAYFMCIIYLSTFLVTCVCCILCKIYYYQKLWTVTITGRNGNRCSRVVDKFCSATRVISVFTYTWYAYYVIQLLLLSRTLYSVRSVSCKCHMLAVQFVLRTKTSIVIF